MGAAASSFASVAGAEACVQDELFAALNDDARAVLTDAMGASWAPRPRGGFAPPEDAKLAGSSNEKDLDKAQPLKLRTGSRRDCQLPEGRKS